jgi:hypothetical protein
MKRSRVWAAALVAAMMHWGSPAAAEETGATRTREVWYGWQTLSTDAAALALGLGLGQVNPKVGGYTVLGGYLLGGPTVHILHGQYGRAGISLGLRAVLPLTLGLGGLALGSAQCDKQSDSSSEIPGMCSVLLGSLGAITGGVAGIIGASALDMGFVARKQEPIKEGVSWSPVLAPQRDGVVLGAVGRW